MPDNAAVGSQPSAVGYRADVGTPLRGTVGS